MFEPKTKTITRWGLTVNGSDVYLSTKEITIYTGKRVIALEPDTKMFEEYKLWDLTQRRKPKLIDEQRFDRTILLK